MSAPADIPWPHAPVHRLTESGIFMVTAGTYRKAHHFRTQQRLDVPERGLLTVCRDFGWRLEAWAVFSNHYHFVAASANGEEGAESLAPMLGRLHAKTAGWKGAPAARCGTTFSRRASRMTLRISHD